MFNKIKNLYQKHRYFNLEWNKWVNKNFYLSIAISADGFYSDLTQYSYTLNHRYSERFGKYSTNGKIKPQQKHLIDVSLVKYPMNNSRFMVSVKFLVLSVSFGYLPTNSSCHRRTRM